MVRPTCVLVIRHGEAENNIQERYNSNPANPGYFVAHLTQLGKSQVQAAAQELRAQGIQGKVAHVSPLPRAQETAQILRDFGVIRDCVTDDRLIEVNMGDREGHRYDEFPEDSWDHSQAATYRGESDADVAARTRKALTDAIMHDTDDLVIFVTHGTPALTLIHECTGNAVKLPQAGYMIIPVERA